MKKHIYFYILAIIAMLSFKISIAKPNILDNYRTYYTILEQVTNTKFVNGKGIPWKSQIREYLYDYNDDPELTYLVIDTAGEFEISEGYSQLIILTHKESYYASGDPSNVCHGCSTDMDISHSVKMIMVDGI